MFTREDYISIAKIIIGTEWDDESSVEKIVFVYLNFKERFLQAIISALK